MTLSHAKLSILHVASHEGIYRGGAVQLQRIALEQARRGHRVAVAVNVSRVRDAESRRLRLETWQPLVDAGIALHPIKLEKLFGVFSLRGLIRRGRFDVVHAHRDQALFAAWLACWGKKRPALIAQRGTESAPRRGAARALLSPRTGAVVAVAEAVRDSLIAMLGAGIGAKTRVVYGGVDLHQFSPAAPDPDLRAQLRLPPDARVVGSLSAWRREKGFEEMMKAMGAVMRARPEIYFLLLGRGVAEEVAPLAARLGIAERCRFVGHQTAVERWLPLMEMTLMVARSREGLSGVLRESLAMGVPVIATACAGNAEIVRDGVTGKIVPARNVAMLERAILEALDDTAGMKAMAENGRRWVEAHCSIDAQADALEGMYRDAMNLAESACNGVLHRPCQSKIENSLPCPK